jgi:hypothetical protein
MYLVLLGATMVFAFAIPIPTLTLVMRSLPPEWVSSCLGVMQVCACWRPAVAVYGLSDHSAFSGLGSTAIFVVFVSRWQLIFKGAGSIPGPIVFGAILDSACLFSQDSCHNGSRACVVMDNDRSAKV